MRERQPVPQENYLSFVSKMIILLGGPNVLTREVTEGILDRKEEIKNSKFGGTVVKIAEQKTELIKEGILIDATQDQFGEVYSIVDVVKDLGRVSQESYEKMIVRIRDLAIKFYKASYNNK